MGKGVKGGMGKASIKLQVCFEVGPWTDIKQQVYELILMYPPFFFCFLKVSFPDPLLMMRSDRTVH